MKWLRAIRAVVVNHNAQHSEVITVESKAGQKKTLSDQKQTHPHIYHAHLIGPCLGQHSVGLFNKEKIHQNTLCVFEICPGL